MRSVHEMLDLTGRVVAITGAAGHIGRACAQALAGLHADIAVIDVESSAANSLAEKLMTDFGVDSFALALDVADEAAAREAPRSIVEKLGHLDVLINAAALVGGATLPGWTCPFEDQSSETWRRALDVNLTGPFVLTQACVPELRASGRGSIINLGSIYGIVGPDLRLYEGTEMGQPAAYAASKGGLLQLSRWLSTVLAPEIRVNSISPGGVWRDQPEEFRRRYKDRTPMRRMATEEDLIGAVAFLASDLSGYVTGQNLVVDGGWTAW